MNEMELLLSPRELYCLGGVMNAEYIDYAYIAALDDIGQDFKLFQKETLASLSAKGVLIEDFGGNTEINEDYLPLLEPVFFGTVETSLDVCTIGEEITVDVYKFHFYNDRITMVKAQDNDLYLNTVGVDDIKGIVDALLPDGYEAEQGVSIDGFDNDTVTRFFAAKNIKIGVISNVRTFIETDGVICTEEGEESLISLSAEGFACGVLDIVKGAF